MHLLLRVDLDSLVQSLWRLFTLQDYNTRVVLLGTVIIGLTSGVLGVYLLLRRRALIGDAISHATLPGVALAFLWSTSQGMEKSLPVLLVGAAISGALGGATVLVLRHLVRIREDAALGIVLSVFFGAGVAVLAIAQEQGNAAGLEGFIYGKAASMKASDVQLSAVVSVLVIGSVLLLGKELKILCFDSALARSQGWPVLVLDSFLIGLVVAATIVGLQAVGLILMIALLVVPAASARFWTYDLNKLLIVSGILGASSCAIGTLLSAAFDKMPSGATIVLVACAFFLLSFAFGLKRGVIWRFARIWEMRRDHDFQHMLRATYEVLEVRGALPDTRHPKSTEKVELSEICKVRSWSEAWARNLATKMAKSDLVVLDARDTIQLTPRGILQALSTVRDHRLLEHYLVSEAEAGAREADREADYLEHGLQPEHLAELSGQLDPESKPVPPPSPHPIDRRESDAS